MSGAGSDVRQGCDVTVDTEAVRAVAVNRQGLGGGGARGSVRGKSIPDSATADSPDARAVTTGCGGWRTEAALEDQSLLGRNEARENASTIQVQHRVQMPHSNAGSPTLMRSSVVTFHVKHRRFRAMTERGRPPTWRAPLYARKTE